MREVQRDTHLTYLKVGLKVNDRLAALAWPPLANVTTVLPPTSGYGRYIQYIILFCDVLLASSSVFFCSAILEEIAYRYTFPILV